MPQGRLEVTGGFFLLAALLCCLDQGEILFPWALACMLHELGHYAAIRFLGGRVAKVRLSACGAEMILSAAKPLGHGALFLAALSGPMVNLALAALLAGRGGEGDFLAGLHLALALFNLLPAQPLDGGRALFSLVALLASPQLASDVVWWTTLLTAGGLLALGFWGMRAGGGFALLPAGLWLGSSLLPRPRRFGAHAR